MNGQTMVYEMLSINSRDIVVPAAYQRRLNRKRVNGIVANFDERIANEPKLSYRDGKYYVFDGQHTISARKKMNNGKDLPIVCKVYKGMTEEEEARLFAQQTGESAPLTPSMKLRANQHGKDAASIAFVEATERSGLQLGYDRAAGIGRITCINTAFNEYKRVGEDIYIEALTIMNEAWNGNPDSLRYEILQAVVSFVELYHKMYDRERLVSRLAATNPLTLYLAGLSDRTLKGKKRFLNLIHRIYNGTNKKGALPVKF